MAKNFDTTTEDRHLYCSADDTTCMYCGLQHDESNLHFTPEDLDPPQALHSLIAAYDADFYDRQGSKQRDGSVWMEHLEDVVMTIKHRMAD